MNPELVQETHDIELKEVRFQNHTYTILVCAICGAKSGWWNDQEDLLLIECEGESEPEGPISLHYNHHHHQLLEKLEAWLDENYMEIRYGYHGLIVRIVDPRTQRSNKYLLRTDSEEPSTTIPRMIEEEKMFVVDGIWVGE